MIVNTEDNSNVFYAIQLARSIEDADSIRWIAECTKVLREMQVVSLIPGKIGRSEPILRRSGGKVISEPLDNGLNRKSFNRLSLLAKTHNVQAFIAHDTDMAALAQRLAQSHPAPVIVNLREKLPKKSLFSGQKFNLHAVNQFLVPTEYMREYLIHDQNIQPEKISVIHSGVDLDNVYFANVSQERTMSLAALWGAIEDSRDIILIEAAFNSIEWRESFQNFAIYAQSHISNDARIIVVGDDGGTGQMQAVERFIMTRAPLAPVRFAGYCADLEAAVKLASLVIILNNPEATEFPLALIAQALGREVAMPKAHPAAQEFLEDGRTGRLIDESPESICDFIEHCLSQDEAARNHTAMAARIFLQNHFSSKIMHEELKKVFENPELAKPLLS